MDDSVQPAGFVCTACGECCQRASDDSGVILNYPDMRKLADFFGLDEQACIDKYLDPIEFPVNDRLYEAFLLKFGERACVFLRPDNKCGVHPAKPTQCRTTPFNFFWNATDGERDLWCMKDVVVDPDWTSKEIDDKYVAGLRPRGAPMSQDNDNKE